MSDIVKMVDIVKALRAVDHNSVEDCFMLSPLFAKAADEIERLRSENAALRTRLAEAESRGRGQGMAIAAGIVCNGYDQPGIAAEILGAAGLTTIKDMRECEVDPYDVKLCRPALKEFRAHRAARTWKEASNG